MTTPFLRFPDVQRVLVDDLQALAGTGHTGTETPADLLALLPFIRVMRRGGPSDLVNDYATVDVDVFATTYAASERLAEQVRQRLVGPPPPVSALDRVRCPIAPRELPWDEDKVVRRFNATYTITARRRMGV